MATKTELMQVLRPKLELLLAAEGTSWKDAETKLESVPVNTLQQCVESGDLGPLQEMKHKNHTTHHHDPRDHRQYINGHKNTHKHHGASHEDGHHGGCSCS